MDAAEARRRVAENAHLAAFISVSEEEGAGPAVAVKDLVDVRGMVTTGGGAILPGTPAEDDAACVAELRRQGGYVIGKANLHEWALGPTSSNPHHGTVRNPMDVERIPGGSSGGSAAAVAAGLCDWAIGTDTGGSIRMPAALCGVVGLKPSLGTVSTEGVFPLAPSLDTVGPIAPDVRTAGAALEMLSGRSGYAPAASPQPPDSFRLAVPAGWVEDLDADTEAVWTAVAGDLPEIAFPDRLRLTEAFAAISGFESAGVHRRWIEECPERYGPDVLERLRAGLGVPRASYEAALREREAVRREVADAMRGWDAIVLPTCACVAPRIDGPDRREPLTRFLRGFSLTGQPALSIPAPAPGLPVGIQLAGRFGEDAALLRVALALEGAWAFARADSSDGGGRPARD